MSKVLDKFDPIAAEEMWERMQVYHPSYAKWVAECVENEIGPQDIYLKVIDTLGTGGQEVAQKCRLAARHLISDQ